MKNTTNQIDRQSSSKRKIRRFFSRLLDLLYPKNIKCIFCGEELNEKSKYSICEECFSSLPFIQNSCPRCSAPISENNQGVCQNCKINNYYFKKAFAVLEYDEMMSRFIHKLKYGGAKYSIEPISNLLKDKLITLNENFDYIAFVPMFKKKENARGYNQSKILAEQVSSLTNIPLLPCVIKIKDNVNQASLDYRARKDNVKDVYDIDNDYRSEIKGKSILIVDDIMTTGSTASEISKVLLSHGASACYVLTLCHGKYEPIPTESTNN